MTGNDKSEQDKTQTQGAAQNTQNNQNTAEQNIVDQDAAEPVVAEPVVVEPTKQEKNEQQAKVEQPNYKDLFLRVSADLQNFQRRVEKQKTEWTVMAQESIILKLIPVIEDLDRALNNPVNTVSSTDTVGNTGAESSAQTAITKWAEGLSVVQKNLKKTLQELGVEIIEPAGDFNPEFQEAVAQIDSPTHKSGQIVDVMSKGYKFKNKVIKFAQVVVAK